MLFVYTVVYTVLFRATSDLILFFHWTILNFSKKRNIIGTTAKLETTAGPLQGDPAKEPMFGPWRIVNDYSTQKSVFVP